MESDTIVAIVTPPGQGGVGIVRTSGPLSPSLAERFYPKLASPWRSHRLRHGTLVDPSVGRSVDRGLACLMVAPGSYTGEDVFEMHCHGSPLVLAHIVRLCEREGCRQARPGEFTLRAFLNGRLALDQAEAVLDVVRANSNTGLDLAIQQLAGWLSARIEPLRHELIGALAHMEAMVDFVEDDIPARLEASAVSQLEKVRHGVETLLRGAEQGIVLREGASLAIVGSPNVGKSSIMNGLLGLERSIVTPVAGTTRDTIEEHLQIGGIAFRTVDTAGLTNSEDVVERIGVERSVRALAGADVALLVLDGSRPYGPPDEMAVETLAGTPASLNGNSQRQRLILALNKSDLPTELDASHIITRLHPGEVVSSTTLQPDGLASLRQALERAAVGGERHEVTVGNVRHQEALRRAGEALSTALDGMDQGTPLDLVSLDVRAAAVALGEITGADVDDELLDRIFRDFCIGK